MASPAPQPPDPPVTALGDALRFVQMSGVFYCPSELTEPWGLSLPPMAHCLWFHVLTEGECTIQVDGGPVDGGEPVRLRPGDMVLVPHGTGHRLWGSEAAPTPSVFDLPHEYIGEHFGVLRHGGGGARTAGVCGGVRFDHPAARHLIDALPPLVHVERSRSPRSEWMHATLDLMADETRAVRPGSDAVVSRLCDILVIQAIRAWMERDPAAQTGWLGALRDDQIGLAIASIHADPAHDWTVASLAEQVGMSRSAFAARFTELVHEPAMRYVTRWRMYQAHHLLQDSDSTVAGVAHLVGYDSEAAFSRAFKRVMGTSPRAAASTFA
jgi:AraC-like DNA-binding protein